MGNIKFQNEDDYTQSANSLFHFMNKLDYLKNALKMKALVPRYCEENIEYLNLQNNGKKIKNIWVLEKCFCDIPFHKVFDCARLNYNSVNVRVEKIDSNIMKDSEEINKNKHNNRKEINLEKNLSHVDLYGYFGIGFSKFWGKQNLLEPVSYLTEQAENIELLSAGLNAALTLDNLDESISNFLIRHLCFIKPVKGKMKRRDSDDEFEILKTFHDEREWRYVPSLNSLKNRNLNPFQLDKNIKMWINDTNLLLMTNEYKDLWLHFNYDDIRYIFVENKEDRLDLIDFIFKLGIENKSLELYEAALLVSKIIVLSELKGDI